MARLTKTEIEQHLLAGKKVEWKDPTGKSASITLDTPKQRRLFAFLLDSPVREVKGIPDDCVRGLAAAFSATGDPANQQALAGGTAAQTGPWKIHAIKTEGFGGVNAWKGTPFELELEGSSILLEGPNGSGKSSLISAIIWALSRERPRDQADAPSDEAKPVFGATNTKAGDWPPIATYPENLAEIFLRPNVRVELTFANPVGTKAMWLRTFDGEKTEAKVDPLLNIPSILLEAGLLMPSRLAKLRLDEGRGRLSSAVQRLTGLDELVELGTFIQGLCHKGRDYLSYKSAELASAKSEFERQIGVAKTALATVSVIVPQFNIADTDNSDGTMARFGKEQNEKAAELTTAVSDDLAPGLDLKDPQTQKQLSLALSAAETEILKGLAGLQKWKTFEAIAAALPDDVRQKLASAIADARISLTAAIEFHSKTQSDTRYRLKAAAARWHAEHGGGDSVDECPMCQHSLKDKPDLQMELAGLQDAGEAATRKLADNVIGIMAELETPVPQTLRRYLSEDAPSTPCADLSKAFETTFVVPEHYQKYLAKCGALSKTAMTTMPSDEMAISSSEAEMAPGTARVLDRIGKIERLCGLAMWFKDQSPAWLNWWNGVSAAEPRAVGAIAPTRPEKLSVHIQRIAQSIAQAEPFRLGAEAMRSAYKQGLLARKIEKELQQRQAIADALAPLKNLGNMADAQARDALNDLSSRIGQIHSANYICDSLKFDSATLERKAGLVVRGQLGTELRIDATLVANTSWIRGALWAFIFALREEAVAQMGADQFPIMLLDDPQQTFDTIHRHRWAEYIAKLQGGTPGVQIILASHDEQFLSFLEVDGVSGRHAAIASAGPELGHIGVFEGGELDRRWQRVTTEKTQRAAQDYMAAVRVYLEGMLKLMLRGEDPKAATFVVGDSRAKLSVLHAAKFEPWARKTFNTLATLLGKKPEIKYIETAHHSDGAHLGMAEAADVQIFWTKTLRPMLEKAFHIVREHRALHGGLSALHALPPTVPLPDGRKTAVKDIKLPLVGSAAALTDGKAADGCVNLHIDGSATELIELKSNVMYRLTTRTLEPVARPGDLLLVSEFKTPSAKSLVVARSEDRLLARRLEIADNHSDVAVLTANAINPRMIAPPVVAKLSTMNMQKIIGVVYDHVKSAVGKESGAEVCDCGGDAVIKSAFSSMRGLVEVDGHSAEPHALDKQFLIIANSMAVAEAMKKCEGQPVIAEDSSGSRYFKRFRSGGAGVIILESLEIGGDFPPVVLADKEGTGAYIQIVWPVVGVLFERPN